jgi:hypothetical protein
VRTSRLLATLFACALGCVPLAHCAGMGEGERCDYNEDCASGLVCIPAGELTWPSGGKTDRGICCPDGDRKRSSAEVCRSASTTLTDSGTPDTGTPQVDAGRDAGDAGSDAPSGDAGDDGEAGSDAASDAAGD